MRERKAIDVLCIFFSAGIGIVDAQQMTYAI